MARRKLIALLAASLVALPAGAGDYYSSGHSSYASPMGSYANGYVTPAGFVYQGGYWYYGGIAYTRTWVPGYYDHAHCWVPGSWEYARVASSYVTPYVAPVVNPAYATGWRTQLLDLARQRDKVELEIRKGSVDHAQYLEAINALGLQGNFRIQGYGQHVAYPGYVTPSLGYHGAQGNTVYGYTYNTVKEAYGSTDMNVLYQQAARLTQGAQGLAGQAHTEFSGLVDQAGSNQARVAEILAKAAAAEKALKAAEPQPSTKTTTSGYGVKITPGTDAPPPPQTPMLREGDPGQARAKSAYRMVAVAADRCMKCHTQGSEKGQVVLFDKDLQWTPNVAPDKIRAAVKSKKMPKDETLTEGEYAALAGE